MSLLYCYNERLMCINIIQTSWERRWEGRALNHGEGANYNKSAQGGTYLNGCLKEGRGIYNWKNTAYLFLFLSSDMKLNISLIIPIDALVNWICEVMFQICCNYQNSDLHDKNDEISNSLNMWGTLCEPIFKAIESYYFSIN